MADATVFSGHSGRQSPPRGSEFHRRRIGEVLANIMHLKGVGQVLEFIDQSMGPLVVPPVRLVARPGQCDGVTLQAPERPRRLPKTLDQA